VGDERQLVETVQALNARDTLTDAIQRSRLRITATGHATNTGDGHRNFEYYGYQRALWVERVLTMALAIPPGVLHVASVGAYDIPRDLPPDASAREHRRVDVRFVEADPMELSTTTVAENSHITSSPQTSGGPSSAGGKEGGPGNKAALH